MALGNTEQTGKILLHHWQAFGAGDVEAIMTDYADDAVLITPEGDTERPGADTFAVRKDFCEHVSSRRDFA
jgi:ketosteroid isomerase-like protein